MVAKKRTAGVAGAGEESLAEAIAGELNKASKEGQKAFFIGEEETPTDLSDFISTGSSLLDLAISNRPNGGIAVGRITELAGLEGSGKSLICAHMIADVQKDGGVAVLIDSEAAVNAEFFEAVGIDMSRLVYIPCDNLEEAFEHVEMIIERIRKNAKNNKKVLIIIDSLAALLPKAELELGFEQQGFGTQKAKLLSRAMAKLVQLIARQRIALVLTNQLRMKLNAQPFADPYITPGGKAVPFYASTRVRLSMSGPIKNANKEQIGVNVNAKIIKNRLGPPNRVVKFDVFYDRGIDDVSSWLAFLKEKEIITGTNGRFTFVDQHGEEHKFQTSTWKEFTKTHPETFEEIYTKISEAMIMSYKSDGLSTLDGTAVIVEANDGALDFEGVSDS